MIFWDAVILIYKIQIRFRFSLHIGCNGFFNFDQKKFENVSQYGNVLERISVWFGPQIYFLAD